MSFIEVAHKPLYRPTMARKGSVKISGTAFRLIREKLQLTRAALGREIGLSESRIQQIESLKEAAVFPDVIRGMAKVAGFAPETMALSLNPPSVDWDENVHPYSEVAVPEIPTFDLPIAAGPWMELPAVEEHDQKPFSSDGRFRIFIRGNSMEKVWPDGSLVEFRRAGKLEIGADYYVQKAECATFKRLESFDDESLVLRALNRRKYPEEMRVLRADVSQMAKAEYILMRPKIGSKS